VKNYNDLKIVVVGAARQGLALSRYFVLHGARVVLNDKRAALELNSAQAEMQDLSNTGFPLEWVLGGHPLSLLDDTDLLCPSAGVPLDIPLVIEARARGIKISNDSQVFMDVVPCKVIGITGSAGKTTTTALVGSIARQSLNDELKNPPFQKIWVGGNIGSPLISFVDEMEQDDIAIMELSSFQLEIMSSSPHVVSILNVTPNHLDRHATLENYTAAKANILKYQDNMGLAVLGRDDPIAWSLRRNVQGKFLTFGFSDIGNNQVGSFMHNGDVYLRDDENDLQNPIGQRDISSSLVDRYVITRDDIQLRGDHNLLNVMAACAICSTVDIPIESMRRGIQEFKGLPHRLEYVRTCNGADWYNDSIATAPERAIAAINSFDKPLILLAGGRDKNLPWEEFAALVHSRVNHVILFGEATETILRALALQGDKALTISCKERLYDAVQYAARIVKPGEVVLLSPGGTSFDEFRDFEERGECFVQWVNELG